MSPVKRSPATNPFLVGGTPVKRSPLNPSSAAASGSSSSFLSKATAAADGTPKKKSASSSTATSSAYHHPLSPNKLAALISSHSTTGAPNDAASLRAASGAGWTPRTKARKRLNGELGSGSTPVKRRRGAGGVAAASDDNSAALSSAGAPLPTSVEEDEKEIVIAPTPLKESDQPRRALPVAPSLLDDEGGSSSDDDGMHASADVKGKGKATLAGKPRMLFAGGKSSVAASIEGSTGTTLHPFFTNRTTPLVAPKSEASSASSSRGVPLPTGDGGQWTTSGPEESSTSTSKAARSATPPPATAAVKAAPAKKPRKYAPSFGKINMTAAAKAKAEQAASRMQGEEAEAEGSEESEDEILRRVVKSHLLGKAGQNRTGRGRRPIDPLPVKPIAAGKRSAAADSRMDDEDDAQVDPDEEGLWQSDLDDDLRPDGYLTRTSPRKKANTLYGLPQAFAEEGDDPRTLVEASDGSDTWDADADNDDDDDDGKRDSAAAAARRQQMVKETQGLPPHLLALLSLRSPQIASARTAKRTEDTFRAIFSHSKPSEEEPPEPASLLAPRGRSGRSAKSKRGSAPRPPTPPPVTEAQRSVAEPRRTDRKPKGEVWGLGDVGGGEMDEIEMKDDEWESEPEGWKGAGLEDEDW